jgi:hypothetical protein
MKRRVCVKCGEVFESGHPGALYCTVTCQRAMKAQRRAMRDSKIKHEQIVASESRFFAEVENPTIPQLAKYAELIRDELTQDKPIRFFGTVPMFQPPDGIIFAQQHGLDHVEWLMMHPSMLDSLGPI